MIVCLLVITGILLLWSHSEAATSDPVNNSIRKALDYLYKNQALINTGAFLGNQALIGNRDFAGDWPQYFFADVKPELLVRDVSPFMVAFMHHSLTNVVESNLADFNLDPSYGRKARFMRQQAIQFMRIFSSAPRGINTGPFGFWPSAIPGSRDSLLGKLAFEILQGPVLEGNLKPVNLSFYPNELAIPDDADCTANIYVSFLNDLFFDGGKGLSGTPANYFADWRDTGVVPRRLNPAWMPVATGVYLTWLNYHNPPDPGIPNGVDLVVNANVLFALARYGVLNTPGVQDSINLINFVTTNGLHRTNPDEISDCTGTARSQSIAP